MNEHKNIITIEDEIKEFSDKPVKSSALFKALEEKGLPDASEASVGDTLALDEDKKPIWTAPSGGGGSFPDPAIEDVGKVLSVEYEKHKVVVCPSQTVVSVEGEAELSGLTIDQPYADGTEGTVIIDGEPTQVVCSEGAFFDQRNNFVIAYDGDGIWFMNTGRVGENTIEFIIVTYSDDAVEVSWENKNFVPDVENYNTRFLAIDDRGGEYGWRVPQYIRKSASFQPAYAWFENRYTKTAFVSIGGEDNTSMLTIRNVLTNRPQVSKPCARVVFPLFTSAGVCGAVQIDADGKMTLLWSDSAVTTQPVQGSASYGYVD